MHLKEGYVQKLSLASIRALIIINPAMNIKAFRICDMYSEQGTARVRVRSVISFITFVRLDRLPIVENDVTPCGMRAQARYIIVFAKGLLFNQPIQNVKVVAICMECFKKEK